MSEAAEDTAEAARESENGLLRAGLSIVKKRNQVKDKRIRD
jgi:hypothetical protein